MGSSIVVGHDRGGLWVRMKSIAFPTCEFRTDGRICRSKRRRRVNIQSGPKAFLTRLFGFKMVNFSRHGTPFFLAVCSADHLYCCR